MQLGEARLRELLTSLLPRDLWHVYEALRTDWPLWAREKQRFPWRERFRYLVVCAGRGFGKTLMGAETTREAVESGEHEYVSICAPTVTTLYRDQLTGPTGLMTISPRWFMPHHHSTKNELRYPRHPVTGVRTRVALLSADKPDRIRSSQCSFVWADEPQSWTKAQDSFNNLDMSLRLPVKGAYPSPRGIITMTPKLNPFSFDLIVGRHDRKSGKRTPRPGLRVVGGSTYENTELDEETLENYRQSYEGTPEGQMELHGKLPLVPEGALWTQDTIDRFRVSGIKEAPVRFVVGLDPSVSPTGARDEAGIIVAALGPNGHVYIVEDATVRGSPLKWATKAASAALKYSASDIVWEQNNVSEEMSAVIAQVEGRTQTKWEPRMAKTPKDVRAAPVALMYEAGMVHHVGRFENLEIEMTTWDPTDKRAKSPNRVDALVWAVVELSPSKRKAKLAYA